RGPATAGELDTDAANATPPGGPRLTVQGCPGRPPAHTECSFGCVLDGERPTATGAHIGGSARVLSELLHHSAWNQVPTPIADAVRHGWSGDAVARASRRPWWQPPGPDGRIPTLLGHELYEARERMSQVRCRRARLRGTREYCHASMRHKMVVTTSFSGMVVRTS